MANPEHLKILKQGVKVWNAWRRKNPDIKPDLSQTDLSKRVMIWPDLSPDIFVLSPNEEPDLITANLKEVNLKKTSLEKSVLIGANFSGSDLSGATLNGAILRHAKFNRVKAEGTFFFDTDLFDSSISNSDFSRARMDRVKFAHANIMKTKLIRSTLVHADLSSVSITDSNLTSAYIHGANLNGTKFQNSDLFQANLQECILVETHFEHVDIRECLIYGISAWNLSLKNTKQSNLIITHPDEATITVDNIEVAQFVHLLLKNEKLRSVIDTITSKVVLILGRFTKPRKAILDAIRNELRHHDYLPVLFDFDKPASRDIDETVGTLARMARFVIADITNPRSIPQELVSIVEQLPSLPVKPLLQLGSQPWGMYEHIKRYPWVLEIYKYRNLKSLLGSIGERVIAPVEEKWAELNQKG